MRLCWNCSISLWLSSDSFGGIADISLYPASMAFSSSSMMRQEIFSACDSVLYLRIAAELLEKLCDYWLVKVREFSVDRRI